MPTNEKEIKEVLVSVQSKLKHVCDFNYLNSAAITVESWEGGEIANMSSTDCYFLSLAFLKLANLLKS
jgi:phage-related protein